MYESFDFTNDRLDIKLNAFKDKEGEIWFIGKEVAEVLGIKDTRQALRNQVLEEDKLFLAGEEYKKFVGGIQHPPQNNKVRNIALITESGLYDLVLSSKKKEAKDAIDSSRKYGRLGDYYLTREINKEIGIHEILDY